MLVPHNAFSNLSNQMTQYTAREFKGSKAAENFSWGRIKNAAKTSNIEHDWSPVKYLNVLPHNRTQKQLQ